DQDGPVGGKADDVLNTTADTEMAIRWVIDAAEYRAATLQTYGFATSRLEQLVEDGDLLPGTWGVSLDADETVISNARYQLERDGLADHPGAWTAWAHRKEATAIAGAAECMTAVQDLGGYVAVVTNRSDDICDVTRENLIALEIPFDTVLCRTTSS